MSLITRSAMRSYLDCAGVYCEIGEGFTEFTENKNPREYERQYINEATERTDIVGYATSVTYAFDVYEDDPVAEKLLSMTLGENVGADARVTVVTAFLYKESGTPGRVAAVKRDYTVCPTKLGSGTEALICAGNLKACGAIVHGTFDVAAKQFYAEEG